MLPTTKSQNVFTADVAGKEVTLTISSQASDLLDARPEPIVAEAEILFSCLIRKELSFREASPDRLSWPVTDQIHVSVRPVLYEMCLPEDGGPEPKIVDFAVADIAALIPKSFDLDVAGGELTGTFTLG